MLETTPSEAKKNALIFEGFFFRLAIFEYGFS